MALRCAANVLLRNEITRQIYTTPRISNKLSQTTQILLPQTRFASDKPDIVVDCSGNSCEPIKRGSYCAPGTEEYCIAGHMPGEEEVEVGAHSTVTPGQYSVLNKQSKEAKDGNEVKTNAQEAGGA